MCYIIFFIHLCPVILFVFSMVHMYKNNVFPVNMNYICSASIIHDKRLYGYASIYIIDHDSINTNNVACTLRYFLAF